MSAQSLSARRDGRRTFGNYKVCDRRLGKKKAQTYMLVPEARLTVQVYDSVSTVSMFSSYKA